MPQERKWVKSTKGPDEVDIETMMRAMGALHSGVVEIQFSPLGIGSSGGVQTIACMRFAALPGSSLPSEVGTVGLWPCKQCASFWGHMYHQLHELDREIAKVYEQRELWE